MNRKAFWQLVERLIEKTEGNLPLFEGALDEHLRSLGSDGILQFASVFNKLLNETDTESIFDAACIIGCGDSDDGLIDFRRWIVVQGESPFQRILENPDYLGVCDRSADPLEQWYCEYDPSSAYREMTGMNLPALDKVASSATPWERKKSSDLASLYPQLWNRLHNKKKLQQQLQRRARTLFVGTTLDRFDDCGAFVRFVFSSGAEILIYDYCYIDPSGDNSATTTSVDRKHPSIGYVVISFDDSLFPEVFHLWFDNRRKLAFGKFHGWPKFTVFDNAEQLYP